MQISARIDSNAVMRMLRNVEKQARYASVLALNETAEIIRKAEVAEMVRVFDAPTPFTLRSVLITRATKAKPEAVIFLRNHALKGVAPAKYLRAEVEGGTRRYKGMEQLLRNVPGGLLPNEYMMPGEGARLDAYGNVSRGQVQQILSVLRAQRDPYQNTKKGAKNAKRYFIAHINGRKGIYERVGQYRIMPVFIVVKKTPKYQPRFRFYDVARNVAKREINARLKAKLAHALATAR